MSTAENAKLQYEAGQQAVAMSALTDSGDHIVFSSADDLWSGRAGYAPVVRPNGLLTGGVVTPDDGLTNDVVDVAALTCNLNGVVQSVSAGPLTALRGSSTNICRITSITVAAGGALAAVAGTAHTAFSETRGALGGPPLIAVDSIEIGQVRLGSITAGVVTAAEIFQIIGLHQESAANPLYTLDYKTGGVVFLAALPLIHTGSVGKKVYASYNAPIFADVALASDFVPPETTHSVSSTPVYGTTIGSSSSSLGQGTFTAYLTDGITDPLVLLKNATLWFKFFSNKYDPQHILCQGKLGIARTFPAAGEMQAACTISAATAAVEKAS